MRQSGIETKIQMNSQPHAIMLTSPQTDNGEARIDRKNEMGPKADLKEMKVIRTIFFNSRFGTSSGCSLALFGGCYFEILLGVYWFVLVCLRSLREEHGVGANGILSSSCHRGAFVEDVVLEDKYSANLGYHFQALCTVLCEECGRTSLEPFVQIQLDSDQGSFRTIWSDVASIIVSFELLYFSEVGLAEWN